MTADPIKAAALAQQQHAEGIATFLAFTATDDAGAEWAVETAKTLREQQRAMVAVKETITRPLFQAHKAACALFKPPHDAVQRVIDHLKATAHAHYQRKAAEQRVALQAAAATANPAQLQAAVEISTARPAALPFRTDYSARVVDPKQVPGRFWIIDQAALDAHAREAKDAFAVPGVELVRVQVPILR